MINDAMFSSNTNEWATGKFVLIPNIHTETFPEKYEIYYRITYDNGKIARIWEEVSKSENEAAAETFNIRDKQ